MLEIPESLTIARQINETVREKKIVRVETEHTKHGFAWYEGDPQKYAALMEGQTVGEARGIGSMVEIEVGELRFVIGDGVNLRLYQPETPLPPRYQTCITLEGDIRLVCTVQMYGNMLLIRPETYDNPYYLAAKSKPLPGTEEFDYAYFTFLRDGLSGSLSAKAFLATEQRIPGLGNGVLQDILLEAGLHPKRKTGTLTEADWKRTYEVLLRVLREMTESGGRDTEKDLFGRPGGYRTRLSKRTAGGPCPYCGNSIQKMTYLGGTVYFCPECQKS